jgi:monofunctional biosynthetic peptidoglycan transglycosylase
MSLPQRLSRVRRLASAWVLALLILVLIWQLWYFAWVLLWKYVDPDNTHFMNLRLAALQQTRPEAALRKIWRPYAQLSDHLKRAVVAAEDDQFIDHDGFDWDGIQQALEKNQKKGKLVAGGSTISQQLAKNLLLSPDKSFVRKAQEAVITLWIEMLWDKRRILEVYLNVVEWGEGLFGAEAAARRYFGVSASALTPAQAARLAVMLPAPRRYEKNPWSAYLNHRTALIINRMASADIPANLPMANTKR